MSDAHAPHAPQFAGSDPHETLSTDEYKHFHVHVTPFWPMFWVFAILLFLTALTVWSSNVHGIQVGNTWIAFSGLVHILIAMGIAVVKATLVGAYFMHLKYDKPMNTVVVSATIFGVVDPLAHTSDIRDPEAVLAGNPALRVGGGLELTYGAP